MIIFAVCYYNHQKYQNGEEVGTEQPCLSCTCKKGILVCSLRVCPPVTPPTAPNTRSNGTHCQVVREGNACCPSLKCVPEKGEEEEEEDVFDIEVHLFIVFGVVDHNQPNKESGNQEDFTVTPLITLNNSYFASSIRGKYLPSSPFALTIVSPSQMMTKTWSYRRAIRLSRPRISSNATQPCCRRLPRRVSTRTTITSTTNNNNNNTNNLMCTNRTRLC